MFGALIRSLIFICLMVLAYHLVVWVLAAIGLALPHMVLVTLGVILVLVAILVLYRLWEPHLGRVNWWGSPPP